MGLTSVCLLFCGDVLEYFGGVIKGSGNERLCGRLRSDCSVQSHKTQKVVLRDNHLYIRAPRGEQALTDNALDAGQLEQDTISKMMELSKPIDLWVAYFVSLALDGRSSEDPGIAGSASSAGSEPWEKVGAPTSLEDFERARATLKTPKRLRVGPLLSAFVDTSPSGGVALEALGEVVSLPAGSSSDDREIHTREAMLRMIGEWSRVK